jgi:ATP-binding cassette subfamily F protein 3
MPLIAAAGLGKQYGTQVCFRDAEFALAEGARVGLIGANGAGKTTLFRIVLGAEDYDGTISRRKDMRIATLDQDPKFPEGFTVREAVVSGVGHVADLEHEIHEIHDRLAHETLSKEDSAKLLDKLGDLQAEFEHEGGYEIDNRADRILEGLGFPRSRHEEKIATLSGGERNRVAFGRLLMVEPDLWLLDEPTNHLDLDGILFLEETMAQSKSAAIIISHDRRLLDDLTSETWEIDAKKIYTYPAPYSRARELRLERIKAGQRAFEKQAAEIDKTEEFIRRYGAGQRARQATGRKKRLERLSRLTRPEDRARVMDLDFPIGEKPGRKILKVRDLAMAYGERRLFQNLDFEIEAGETLGIMGPNGAGKTTLFKALLGQLPPTHGEVFWGERVRKAFLSQIEAWDDQRTTPFEFLRGVDKHKSDLKLRSLLAAMLFRGDEIDKPVAALSGGERKRLMLTRILLQGNNVLLLDEPTNHLDIPSREALELALSVYEGTLLVISHDRHFLDQAADRILWIEDGAWRITEGGYVEAQEARKRERERLAKPRHVSSAPVIDSAPPPPKRQTSAFSRLSTEELERKIVKCEEWIAALNVRFADPAVFKNPEELRNVQDAIRMAQAELKTLESEYGERSF